MEPNGDAPNAFGRKRFDHTQRISRGGAHAARNFKDDGVVSIGIQGEIVFLRLGNGSSGVGRVGRNFAKHPLSYRYESP